MAAHSCKYKGHKEKCLIGDSYPISKNNKLSCKRVKNALARGSQYHDTQSLKRAGLCNYAKRCGVKKSSICK